MSPIKIGDEPPRDSHPIVDVFNAAVKALYEMHQHQAGEAAIEADEQASGDTDDVPN
jgi:hypothetical protein